MNEILALASPAATATTVGAPGIVEGVAGFDATESTEFPMAFVATTLNVYGVPFVSPETVQPCVGGVEEHVPAI